MRQLVVVSHSAPSASQVWLHAPYELHLSLFEHFIELLTESRLVLEECYIFSLTICSFKSDSYVKSFFVKMLSKEKLICVY